MMTSSDEGLLAYLANITRQLEAWLLGSAVQKLVRPCVLVRACVRECVRVGYAYGWDVLIPLYPNPPPLCPNPMLQVLVVKGVESGDTLERWVFGASASAVSTVRAACRVPADLIFMSVWRVSSNPPPPPAPFRV